NADIANINGSITNNGILIITGSITSIGKLEIKGGGTVTLNGGSVESTGDGVVIESGAVLNLANGSSIVASTGVINSGSINADGSGNSISGGVSGSGYVDPDLGDCSVSCSDGALPIEMLFFNGIENGSSSKLRWATGSELNNHFFEVYKSYDGVNFSKIGKVEGNGTTTERKDYKFEDEGFSRSSYYRLKQIDFDGTFEYSKTIRVTKHQNTNSFFWPNPLLKGDQFTLATGSRNQVTIAISDLNGKSIYGASGSESDVASQFEKFSNSLEKKIYLISIKTEFGQLTERLVVR
ncbi:MAG: T9SS type A sorting domain-containing protein, partial [Imperialibacter sp.]